jgi:hypothetical protein
MRANNFCVKALSKAVAFDFQNKNYNLYLRQTPVAPSIGLSIMRLHHVMCGVKARIEMEGLKCQHTKQLSHGASEENGVLMLEGILTKCLIFDDHQPTVMYRDYFWKSVHLPVCVGSEMDRDKTTTSYTDHKHVLLNRLMGEGISIRDNRNDDDVSNGSIDESIHGDDKCFHDNNHGNLDDANSDSDVDECELTSEELAKQASDALKSLGNVQRKA